MQANQPEHERLAGVFGDLAVEMRAREGSPETLRSTVGAATRIVPGARWAGVSLIQGKKVIPEVPSSRNVAELNELQSHLNEGPCLTSLRDHHTVQIDDMRTETRWPTYAREVQQRGILSLLSFRLFVRSENLGALTTNIRLRKALLTTTTGCSFPESRTR